MAPHPLILFSGLVLLDSPAAASLWEVQLNSPSPSGFAGQRRHLATLLALHGGSSHSDAPNAVKLSSVSFASPRSKRAKELRVATNLLLWWSLNVVFNLANKQCLNSWQHPWALATTHLAVGSACMLPLWLPYPSLSADGIGWASVREPPSLTTADLRTLLPVVLLLATGHATSTLAPAYGTVAFSNIIKTAEPLFTCIFAALLYKRIFSPAVYASLLVVVIGVGLVSCRDVNFSSFSLVAGMTSNAAFALYSISAKQLLVTRDPQTTYALLTMLSCLVLLPVAGVMEWSGAGTSRLAAANLAPAYSGARLISLLVCTGLLQYLSNEIAFCTLSMIHPVTYALANTFKRSVVVGVSLLVFKQRLTTQAGIGAALALVGALSYSLAITQQQVASDRAAIAASASGTTSTTGFERN